MFQQLIKIKYFLQPSYQLQLINNISLITSKIRYKVYSLVISALAGNSVKIFTLGIIHFIKTIVRKYGIHFIDMAVKINNNDIKIPTS